MNATALLLIALGGALGSVLRALASWAIPAGRLPWATLGVNIAGSLLIGALMARWALTDPRAQSFWVVGVCGGFTTFSSFSWQTFELAQRGNWAAAVANIFLSVTLCLLATWLGWRLAR
ncbi:MAG TPA: fluoride efflux transporter CrcB [Opitutaceae bacterium]|nr:fluoride efflux transporter CrcB [Opitutaceae bacterium]